VSVTERKEITLSVNGSPCALEVKVNRVLLDVLREDLGLTGTKEGCGMGVCGACTVLLDGKPVNACLTLAVEAEGKEITTVEGLTRDGKLDALQEAFVEEGAVQCGFCTPGMLITGKGFLAENPSPTELEVRKAIAGNLCRCTGYVRIVKAILKASQASTVNARKSGEE
jgi:aerobic carbon-monoxide dehydrogenase small subunit